MWDAPNTVMFCCRTAGVLQAATLQSEADAADQRDLQGALFAGNSCCQDMRTSSGASTMELPVTFTTAIAVEQGALLQVASPSSKAGRACSQAKPQMPPSTLSVHSHAFHIHPC
jgi:hypothetical protein